MGPGGRSQDSGAMGNLGAFCSVFLKKNFPRGLRPELLKSCVCLLEDRTAYSRNHRHIHGKMIFLAPKDFFSFEFLEALMMRLPVRDACFRIFLKIIIF